MLSKCFNFPDCANYCANDLIHLLYLHFTLGVKLVHIDTCVAEFLLDLNLLDWSSTNLLAVCLGPRLYLWNASNGEIHQLLEMDSETEYVSSVAWIPDASHIAIGTSTSEVQVL